LVRNGSHMLFQAQKVHVQRIIFVALPYIWSNYMHMQTIKRGHHIYIYHLIYCNYQILLNAIGRRSDLALLVNSPPIFI